MESSERYKMSAKLVLLSYDIPKIRKSVAEIKKTIDGSDIEIRKSSQYTNVPVTYSPKIWGYDGKPTIKKKTLHLYGEKEDLIKILKIKVGKIPKGVVLRLI